MKLYFLSYYFLFVVFVGVYGNLRDAAVGYSDSDDCSAYLKKVNVRVFPFWLHSKDVGPLEHTE